MQLLHKNQVPELKLLRSVKKSGPRQKMNHTFEAKHFQYLQTKKFVLCQLGSMLTHLAILLLDYGRNRN